MNTPSTSSSKMIRSISARSLIAGKRGSIPAAGKARRYTGPAMVKRVPSTATRVMPSARLALGNDVGDIEAGQRQLGPGRLERDVGRIVGAGEEVACPHCSRANRFGEERADRRMVAGVPSGHDLPHRLAVQHHVRVHVGPAPESLPGRKEEAEGRPFPRYGRECQSASVPPLFLSCRVTI